MQRSQDVPSRGLNSITFEDRHTSFVRLENVERRFKFVRCRVKFSPEFWRVTWAKSKFRLVKVEGGRWKVEGGRWKVKAYRLIKSRTPFPVMDSAKEIERERNRRRRGYRVKIKDRGSRIAFTADGKSGQREACNISIPIGRLAGNGHTCRLPTMDANEVTLCNSIWRVIPGTTTVTG